MKRSRTRFATIATGLSAIAALAAAPAMAVDQPVGVARFAQPVAPAPRPKMAKISPQMLFLIRSVLSALDDANRTGNYTVLRDLASPAFQASNTAADLSLAFSDLRRRNVDLGAATLQIPLLNEPVGLDNGRRLRLTGQIATAPEGIAFDFRFEAVAGHWRPVAISVSTLPVASAQTAP